MSKETVQMNVEYQKDRDGFDVRYIDGVRQGRVPHSNECDDDTQYVIRYITTDEDSNNDVSRWEYRHIGAGYQNLDGALKTLKRLPWVPDEQHVQILLNFGRIEEEFGMERVTSLTGPDQYLPVYRIAAHKERTLNITYRDDITDFIVDSEPSARGEGESPTDIEPVLFRALLGLIRESDRIKRWDETWNDDSDAFQRGEFYALIHAPLFAAYSIIDEEFTELVNRYHLEKGTGKHISGSFIRCGFRTKVQNVSSLLSQKEQDTILEAWECRNDLIHGIHSRFGVQLREIDFERLSKQLLYAIMKTRTLNAYVNSVAYRTGIETPEEAIAHLVGTSTLQDAIDAAKKAINDERHFQPLYFTPRGTSLQ